MNINRNINNIIISIISGSLCASACDVYTLEGGSSVTGASGIEPVDMTSGSESESESLPANIE